MGPAPRPSEPITGGCLCGGVRYEVSFPEGSKWPPYRSTCQCTMCRKWTSSLIPQSFTVQSSQVKLPSNESKTYQSYRSSTIATRTFCNNCGSSIVFIDDDTPDEIEIWVGTVDEKWLIGEKVERSERKTERGVEFDRRGGYPRELCTVDKHSYLENAVKGITDTVVGEKYLWSREGGPWY